MTGVRIELSARARNVIAGGQIGEGDAAATKRIKGGNLRLTVAGMENRAAAGKPGDAIKTALGHAG